MENVRFKGKVAVWFWGICIFAEGNMLYGFIREKESRWMMGISLVLLSALMLPILFRNYVLIKENRVIIIFGFFRDSMEIREIREIYRSRNPLSSTAASLDRIVIKGRRQEMICAVRDKENLFQELKRRNPGIHIH